MMTRSPFSQLPESRAHVARCAYRISSALDMAPPGMDRVPECGEQLGVQIAVGVQTTAPVAGASAGSIGEAAARLLYEKDPGRVVPDMAALHQEAVDLTAYKFNERKGASG